MPHSKKETGAERRARQKAAAAKREATATAPSDDMAMAVLQDPHATEAQLVDAMMMMGIGEAAPHGDKDRIAETLMLESKLDFALMTRDMQSGRLTGRGRGHRDDPPFGSVDMNTFRQVPEDMCPAEFLTSLGLKIGPLPGNIGLPLLSLPAASTRVPRPISAQPPRQASARAVPAGPGPQLVVMGFGAAPWSLVLSDEERTRAFLRPHPKFHAFPVTEPAELPFVIEDRAGRGKAMIATRDIARGETVVCEPPLVISYANMTAQMIWIFDEVMEQNMHPKLLAEFDALHNCKPYDICHRHCIMRTNAVGCGYPWTDRPQSGVFKYISRANHDCNPNTKFHWDVIDFRMSLIAKRRIRKGDEIYCSYVGTLDDAPKAERQAELKRVYHFDCTCERCAAE